MTMFLSMPFRAGLAPAIFALAVMSCYGSKSGGTCQGQTETVEPASSGDDWSRWRGPTGDGIAADDQKPPVTWSEEQNVIWKTKVPGRGHASPIILGEEIFLATADKATESQSVICYDRADGSEKWRQVINTGELEAKVHPNNSRASSTIATDGTRLFAAFSNHGSVHVTALDLAGKELWRQTLGVYVPVYPFGFGASPIVFEDLVIVTNENRQDSAIVAYEAATGQERYRIKRDGISSYSTPVVANVGGKEQLFISGGRSVVSYDPRTGEKNWSVPTKWDVSCGTMVWDGDLVFASGGFPAQQTLAVNASSGQLVWENSIKAYEQSMIVVDGYLYAHSDNGGLYCWRAKDGKEMWKERFKRGESASPVLANGHLYFTAEDGETIVIKANPRKFEQVSRNRLGNSGFASPAVCGQRLYYRIGKQEAGQMQEYLVCIGEQ